MDPVRPRRVGICEDDDSLRSVLVRALRTEGHDTHVATTGHDAVRDFTARPPDLLILDIGLPDSDGRDVCQALRAQGSTAPVVFLTAADAVTDRLAGFSAGGDDYLTKPFHFDELVARLRAVLRRAGVEPQAAVGDLVLDPVAHALTAGDRTVSLTPTEFRVLAALVARPGAVVRRNELVRAAWPHGAIVHDNTLDQYVARLRRKLREATSAVTIATAHGVGYQLR